MEMKVMTQDAVAHGHWCDVEVKGEDLSALNCVVA